MNTLIGLVVTVFLVGGNWFTGKVISMNAEFIVIKECAKERETQRTKNTIYYYDVFVPNKYTKEIRIPTARVERIDTESDETQKLYPEKEHILQAEVE